MNTKGLYHFSHRYPNKVTHNQLTVVKIPLGIMILLLSVRMQLPVPKHVNLETEVAKIKRISP
jgi:hypothetical protein